jgi:hypothetical protein
MAGTNYQQTANTWIDNAAGFKNAISGQVNVMDSTANFFRLTGVKLELGAVGTPIQYVPFEEELARCQRYYQKSFPYSIAPQTGYDYQVPNFTAMKAGINAQRSAMPFSFIVAMRTQATVTLYNPSAANAQVRNYSTVADHTSSAPVDTSSKGFSIEHTGTGDTLVADRLGVHWTADAEL